MQPVGVANSRRMRQQRIAIIGAGISGLTAAAALLRRGFKVRVYEQAPALGDVGAGLTVSPNATHALLSIGLGEDLRRDGMEPVRGGVKHWQSGELLASNLRGDSMVSQYGAPYYQIHRADLHAALVRAVRAASVDGSDPISLDSCFRSLRHGDAAIDIEFASGTTARADVLIAADGARSTVRTAVFGASQPKFTGYIAFRGLADMARLDPAVIQPTSCISLGPRHSFTRYLVRGGAMVNFVGLAERDDWREEGWSIPSSVAELAAEFDGWYPDIHKIIRATPENRIFKWALHDRDPLPEWNHGCISLLGDAAHPMLPFLGFGAAMGMEDAIVLARAFELSASVPEALRRYQEARLERTTFVMLKARETALQYHSGDMNRFQRPNGHQTAESLGLMAYNPVTVPI
jgi:salicylate hydroxylase